MARLSLNVRAFVAEHVRKDRKNHWERKHHRHQEIGEAGALVLLLVLDVGGCHRSPPEITSCTSRASRAPRRDKPRAPRAREAPKQAYRQETSREGLRSDARRRAGRSRAARAVDRPAGA